MGVAIVDAVLLARTNRGRHADLVRRHEELTADLAEEAALSTATRERTYASLERFAVAFRRLRNAELAELVDVAPVAAEELPNVELRALRVNALGSLTALAGGAAAGGTAGAVAFSAVGVFATASTGTAISTLSGAAATSATLAWLGGGSIASGGGGIAAGTTVLTGIVALPVVVTMAAVVEWQGRRLRRGQRETAAQIVAAEAEFRRAEVAVMVLTARARQLCGVADRLADELDRLLPRMLRQLDVSTDYRAWDDDERGVVAALAALAVAAAAVLAAPVTDEDGAPTDLSEAAAAAAERTLRASALVIS
ncbi:MAG: hypothetical protein PGN11_16040 [Quadrisphaera sp.]